MNMYIFTRGFTRKILWLKQYFLYLNVFDSTKPFLNSKICSSAVFRNILPMKISYAKRQLAAILPK